MGIFDFLRKLKNASVNDVTDEEKREETKPAEKTPVAVEEKPEAVQTVPEEPVLSTEDECDDSDSGYDVKRTVADIRDYFDNLVKTNFADEDFRIDVPAAELAPDCHPACTPIQYLFYKDGKPFLAVVLVQTNTYKGMNVKGTRFICERLGIRYIRFFASYPNEEIYVVERIKKYLA